MPRSDWSDLPSTRDERGREFNLYTGNWEHPVRTRQMTAEEQEQHFPRSSATKGRKTCKVCNKRPPDMHAHFKENSDTHGPISTENPAALQHFPGLDQLSRRLGGLINDKRMW